MIFVYPSCHKNVDCIDILTYIFMPGTSFDNCQIFNMEFCENIFQILNSSFKQLIVAFQRADVGSWFDKQYIQGEGKCSILFSCRA